MFERFQSFASNLVVSPTQIRKLPVKIVEHYLFHIFNLHFFDKSHSTAPYSRLISCVDCTDK